MNITPLSQLCLNQAFESFLSPIFEVHAEIKIITSLPYQGRAG